MLFEADKPDEKASEIVIRPWPLIVSSIQLHVDVELVESIQLQLNAVESSSI